MLEQGGTSRCLVLGARLPFLDSEYPIWAPMGEKHVDRCLHKNAGVKAEVGDEYNQCLP